MGDGLGKGWAHRCGVHDQRLAENFAAAANEGRVVDVDEARSQGFSVAKFTELAAVQRRLAGRKLTYVKLEEEVVPFNPTFAPVSATAVRSAA